MTDFSKLSDDIIFSLHHVADASRLGVWDKEEADAIIGHFSSFAENILQPLNASGDAQGARLEDGAVIMPDGFKGAYAQLAGNGWQGLSAPESYGGMAASPLIAAGVSELFSAANHAMQMVCNLVPGAITTLMRFGTDAQKNRWVPKLASGEVLSTMCLTEPHAGSDLSVLRTKAIETDAGWQITGEKIFISGGDQDLSDSVLHLVLARSGEPEDGLKGLSLYLCEKQPQISIARLEDKMGIHASPTCQMVFDGAIAELIGKEGEGLKAMFTIMNHARLDVALQGVAHAARTHQLARHYAADRKQGRKGDGSAAMLADHADVARMLDRQAALAIGARAMCHIALVELELGNRPTLADFLTPLCKIFCSEAGIEAADLGMQILGGYGYLKEYNMEQHFRDARITAIYEGANGVHKRSLSTRGLREAGGNDEFADLITELANGNEALLAELASWQILRDDVRSADDATIMAHDFANATTGLFYKACWQRIDAVADHHHDRNFIHHLAHIVLAN